MEQYISKRTYTFLFILCGLVYFFGFLFPLIDPEATAYASIAMRMHQNHDFVNIIGNNWNQPSLLFWLVGFSYKIFGIHDWAYRLPSVLMTTLAVYSTYGLGRILYNKEVGRLAALIVATSLTIILANRDVCTVSILTASIIFGIWQLVEFVKHRRIINVILGTISCILIVLHFLSDSAFKQSHYLILLFPLLGVFLAMYLYNLVQKKNWKLLGILEKIQLLVIGILILMSLVINMWIFPIQQVWISIVAFILVTVLFFLVMRGAKQGFLYRIIVPLAFAILAVNFLLNTNFYPQLLKYQAGNEMARIAKENNVPADNTYMYGSRYYSFDFYSQKTIPVINVAEIQQKNNKGEKFYLFVVESYFEDLKPLNLHITRKFETPQFDVSNLTLKFLNPATRAETLSKGYLFEIN